MTYEKDKILISLLSYLKNNQDNVDMVKYNFQKSIEIMQN